MLSTEQQFPQRNLLLFLTKGPPKAERITSAKRLWAGLQNRGYGMKKKWEKADWVWLGAMILVMVGIFLFSSQSGDESSQVSSGFLRFLLGIPPVRWVLEETPVLEILPIRKWGHFTIYLVLGITSYGWARRRVGGKTAWLLAWGIGFLYACTDEFHQLFVPGRSGQWTDVGIDSLGCAAGVLLCGATHWIFRKRPKESL